MLWPPEQTDTRKERYSGARNSEQEYCTQGKREGPQRLCRGRWGAVLGTGYLGEDPEGKGASSGHLPYGWSLESPRKSVNQEAEEGPVGGAFRGQLASKDLKTKKLLSPLKPGLTLLVFPVLPGKIPTWVLHAPRRRSRLAIPARELALSFLVEMLCFVMYTGPPGLSECLLQTLTFSSTKPLCF